MAQEDILNYIKQNKPQEIPESFRSTFEQIKPTQEVVEEDTKGLKDKLIDRATNIFDVWNLGAKQASEAKTFAGKTGRLLESGLRTAGQVAGGALDVAGAVLEPVIEKVPEAINTIAQFTPLDEVVKYGYDALPEEAKEKIDETLGNISEKALEAFKLGEEAYSQFKKENPNLAQDLEAVGNIAAIVPIGAGSKKLGSETLRAGRTIAKDLSEASKLKRLDELAGLKARAEKLTTEVLQTPIRELKTVGIDRTLRGVEEAAKVIKKAKNFREIDKQLQDVAIPAIQRVNDIIVKQADKKVTDFLAPLVQEVKKLESDATKKNIARKYRDILEGEIENLQNAGGSMNILDAQAKKMQLNEDLKKFFNKLDPSELEAADQQARNLVRSGLMKEIEKVAGSEVGKLNRLYAGLSDARSWLNAVDARYLRDVTPTGLQKFLEKIPLIRSFVTGRPDAVIGTRSAGLLEVLPTKTREIEKIREKIAKIEGAIKKEPRVSTNVIESNIRRGETPAGDVGEIGRIAQERAGQQPYRAPYIDSGKAGLEIRPNR